ncbi:MAG TPA: AI-2E family transporter [Baekduia sp.]|uniref:AI-2E family transporter n=1 Tax=Baekduia sp. TaxID=2600305 RepID=UPI002CC66EFD|nr:AI-2E family transporter [Baekduia sp.]HMJ34243.1 AI-2E family transporter [Baekduia sp.]
MIRGRLRHHEHPDGDGDHARRADDDEVVEIDPAQLTGVLRTPAWLRDLGFTAWLLVGVTLLLAGGVWLMALTQTIVMPLITAGVVAAVASPLVSGLQRHRVPRGLGAALILLGLIALAVVVSIVVVGGIIGQSSDLGGHLKSAQDTIAGWLKDLGVGSSEADNAKQDLGSAVQAAVPALLHGVTGGIKQLSSLVVFLSFTALSLFFLLKDGPEIRGWVERHSTVPAPVAHSVSHRVLQSLRGYFFGVTLVAAFNAVVVGAGALLLGVPLAGTIAAVTFLGAYIPYLGAWAAGAFAVLVALGGAGTDAAIGMVILQLLANGILQQLVQPIAYGTALGIHPLAVLVVTIAGGCLFGAAGLVLAGPLTSAITRISADLARARAAADVAPADDGAAAVAAPT